eukprot:1391847-Amorphochlora_amoeboformis.AAC.1
MRCTPDELSRAVRRREWSLRLNAQPVSVCLLAPRRGRAVLETGSADGHGNNTLDICKPLID